MGLWATWMIASLPGNVVPLVTVLRLQSHQGPELPEVAAFVSSELIHPDDEHHFG